METNDEQLEAYCEHCGAPMKSYWHSLTPGLVGTLVTFGQGVRNKGMNMVHLATELKLTHNQMANFQKLRYFGLVVKSKDPKSGIWGLTRLGLQFLKNESGVHKKVRTFRNQIEERSNDLVWFKDFTKTAGLTDFWQKEFEWEIVDYHVVKPGEKVPAQERGPQLF